MYVMIMLLILQGNVSEAAVLPYMYLTEEQCNKELTDILVGTIKEGGDMAAALEDRTVRMQCATLVEAE